MGVISSFIRGMNYARHPRIPESITGHELTKCSLRAFAGRSRIAFELLVQGSTSSKVPFLKRNSFSSAGSNGSKYG